MRNQMKAFRQELFLQHGILSQPIKMPVADKVTPSNVAFAAWRAFAVRVQNEHVWLGIIAGDLTHQVSMCAPVDAGQHPSRSPCCRSG